ncbi:hypothetical protein CK203_049473 [Vitis vinifera]|uniref:Retrotransposon gag domain-containing protein n=1 Tax=Vitis vinifera TaxID=29760 RepID=A0A438HAT3_VITVI|nr:hypothetical protein CK203_049473 [Vitis vinifera]
MPNWIRDSGGRLVKLETPHNKELELSLNIMEATPEDQHSHHGHQDNPNAFINEGPMHPPRMSAPSCIVPPTEQLVIRPHIVPLLPTFHGMESENPYAHIKEFEDVCNTFREGGASIDLMRLKLFPFTLKDKAKIWLNSLRPRTTPRNNVWRDFMSKNPEEAMDFLSYVLKFQGDGMNQQRRSGKDEVSTERLEELELKKMHEVQAVAETPVQVKCPICQSYEHLMEECPTIPAVREMQEHLSTTVGSPSQPAQPSQQSSSLEQAIANLSKVVEDFVGDQKAINAQLSQRIDSVERRMDGMQNDLSQKIDNLQYSISRLTNLNTVQEKGRFPSQPHQNPKAIHEVEIHEGESSQVKDVKALITLRSGKKVEPPTPKPHVEEEEETKKGRK